MSSSLNFAPYSDPPDHTPLVSSSSSSSKRSPLASSSQAPSLPTYSYQDGSSLPQLQSTHGTSYSSSSANSSPYHPQQTSSNFSGVETTINLKLEWLAVLAYCLGPFGAVFELVFEVENDFIRFHAYSSILLCITLAVIHFICYFILWSFVQKLLFLLDIASLAIMSLRAYSDCDHLDRYKLPIIGVLAESWVDAE
ncbi:hypothetical protein JCM5353_004088 [Sporobolomyces roseus]